MLSFECYLDYIRSSPQILDSLSMFMSSDASLEAFLGVAPSIHNENILRAFFGHLAVEPPGCI